MEKFPEEYVEKGQEVAAILTTLKNNTNGGGDNIQYHLELERHAFACIRLPNGCRLLVRTGIS